MNSDPIPAPAPAPVPTRRPRRWPLWLGAVLGLLVLLYLVVTSGPFLRGVVVPRVGAAIGADLSVQGTALSPFSSLELSGVRLAPKGGEPLAQIETVRVRYGLSDILGGTVRVDELTVVNPVITVVEAADGTSNLQRFLDGIPAGKSSADSEPATPPQLAVANVRVSGGRASLVRPASGGGTEAYEVRDLQIGLDRLANGGSGKITLGAVLSVDAATNRLRGALDGEIGLGLSAAAAPERIDGGIRLSIGEAQGAWAQLAGLAARVGLDVEGTEVRSAAVEFSQRDAVLGRIGLKGTLDPVGKEGRLDYEIGGIDRRVLALAGAAFGIDLRETAVEARGRVDLAQRGTVAGSSGTVRMARLSMDLGQGPTPELDVTTDYKATFDSGRNSLLIDTLKVEARRGTETVLTGGLDRPMNLSWDPAGPGFRESTLEVRVNGLELAEWRPLLGGTAPGGRVSATIRLRADQDGRLIQASVQSTADRLVAADGGDALRDAAVEAAVEATLKDFAALAVSRYSLEVSRGNTSLVSVTGVGDWHLTRQEGGIQYSVAGALAPLAALAGIEAIAPRSGDIRATGRGSLSAARVEAAAAVAVTGFSGELAGMAFSDLGVNVDLEARLQNAVAHLDRFNVALRSGLAEAGTVDASGTFEMETRQGRATYRIAGLNHLVLGPVVAAALAPRRLDSANVTASGEAEVRLEGASRLRTRISVADVRAARPDGQDPVGPLGVDVTMDAGAAGPAVDVTELKLDLGKTDRAANVLLVDGKLDLAPTNAAPSSLRIRSDGLDLTPLYDLVASATPAPSEGAAPAVVPPSDTPAPGTEPEPVALPVRRLTADLDIRRVHLREVEISDWKSRLEITDGRLVLRPFGLSLNGAPVSADVDADLSVPGYRYQVGFDAAAVPLTPLVNSFVPDRQGQIGGTATAALKVSGAGVTGANLERNLKGDFGLTATNLNLQLADVRTPVIKTVVNLVLGLPALIRSASNPAAFLETLAGRLTGQAPGWVDEFSRAPLDSLNVAGRAGEGKVTLDAARVVSPAFVANASGAVTLQPVLTNSPIAMPVRIALREDLARQVGVTEAAQAGYAALPDFVSLGGTLGQPKADVDKARLLLLGGKAALGLAGDSAGAAGAAVGNVLNTVKGLVGGGNETNAPAARTNSPLGGLLKALGGDRKPEAADTNAPVAPKANPLDILGIGRPRK